jgi:hypothetical protein
MMSEELKKHLEEDSKIYKWFIILGVSYDHNWLREHKSEDKGYYLFYSSILPLLTSAVNRVKEMVEKGSEFIPALRSEKKIIEEYIEPLIRSDVEILNKVANETQKGNRSLTFTNREYAKLTEDFASILMFLEIKSGANAYRQAALEGYGEFKRKVCEGLAEYEKLINSIRNNTKYDLPYVELSGLTSFLNADAHDGGVISKALRQKNPEILFKEIPEKGIIELIKSVEERVDQLLDDMENWPLIEKHCKAAEIKRRSNLKKMVRYYNELKNLLGELQDANLLV